MKQKSTLRTVGLLLAVLWAGSWAGCTYDNEETLFAPKPDVSSCDSTAVTYSATIAPLMTQHCQGCHNSNRSLGGVIVTSHQSLQTLGRTGQLVGTMAHAPGYSPMPQVGAKLSTCDINKVRIWVRAGMPNN